jgi:hypothetical protein
MPYWLAGLAKYVAIRKLYLFAMRK